MDTPPQTTLVTCSYAPDVERCKYLCASIERHVPRSTPHLLIVPKRDIRLFQPLCNERTRVISAESILPRFVWQLPFQNRWWITPYSIPVRGWIMQQVTKLSAPLAVDTKYIMHVDSDTLFIRPFNPDDTVRGEKVRLFRAEGWGNTPQHSKWHRNSGTLLGLGRKDYFGSGYISQLISWHCDTVKQLHQHIEKTLKIPWQMAVFNSLHFSEYSLYGIFVEHVCQEREHHYFDNTNLCLCSWINSNQVKLDLNKFMENLRPHHAAILMQSTLEMNPEEYVNDIEIYLSTSTTNKL